MLFIKNSYIQYATKRYRGRSIPRDVRHVLKSNYVDYNIGVVNEVQVGGKTAWLVNLQDENNLVIARILDGGLDELNRYQTHFTPRRKGRIDFPNSQ